MLPLWAHRVDWKWLHPCNWMQFYPTFAKPRADIQSLGQHSGPERAGSDATKRTLAWRVHCCVCICVSSVQNLAKYLVTSWHFTYSLHSFFKVHMFFDMFIELFITNFFNFLTKFYLVLHWKVPWSLASKVKKDLRRYSGFNPFTFSKNSNHGREILLEV